MARAPSDPIKKVRRHLEPCIFGEVRLEDLNKVKKDKNTYHLRKYRESIPIIGEVVPEVDSALDVACERLGFPR